SGRGPGDLVPRRLVELLVAQQLDEAAEREDRRPQLVRGVGDEGAPRVLELGELEAHPVEGPRELSELVAAAVDHRLVEVARGDPVGRALQSADPAGGRRGAPGADPDGEAA